MKTKYSKYKSSEVNWIGVIPSHWVLKKNKYVLNEKDEIVGEKWIDYTLLSLSKRGVIIRDIESGKGKFPESFDTYKIVNKNELIFCLYDIEETPRSVGLSDHKGMITGSYKIFSSDKVNVKFIYYYYLCIDDVKGLKPYYTGLRNVVRPETFGGLKLYLPPLPEQEQIVKYLDEKTTQVDNLIFITEKKIEVLKEKRTSLINTVVTKGLNPKVELKDSGVEWIGEIPKHWDNITLRYLNTKVGSGVTPRGGSEVYVDEGVIFIRSQNVHFDGLRLDEVVKIEQETHDKMSGTKIQFNDVLLNITGGSIGRCSVVEINEEMNVNQHVCIIRTNERIKPHYLNFVLQSYIGQTQVDLYITGGNREGLNIENIKNFFISLPPIKEQDEIVKYISSETIKIDNLVSIEQRRIETLKEYRQSLINEVVTGKVRVCEKKISEHNLVLEK